MWFTNSITPEAKSIEYGFCNTSSILVSRWWRNKWFKVSVHLALDLPFCMMHFTIRFMTTLAHKFDDAWAHLDNARHWARSICSNQSDTWSTANIVWDFALNRRPASSQDFSGCLWNPMMRFNIFVRVVFNLWRWDWVRAHAAIPNTATQPSSSRSVI